MILINYFTKDMSQKNFNYYGMVEQIGSIFRM